jgi:hypothetical protein
VVLGICYNLSVQDVENFQIQATRVLGFLLKLQTEVISGSGHLKKVQRTGWFPERNNYEPKVQHRFFDCFFEFLKSVVWC